MENKNYHIVVTLLWKCCEGKIELPQCYNFVIKMLGMKKGSTKIPMYRNVRHMCTCIHMYGTCAFTCAHVQITCTHVQKMLFSGNREIIFCIFREPGSHFPGISFNFSLAQGYFSTLTHVQHMCNTCAKYCC